MTNAVFNQDDEGAGESAQENLKGANPRRRSVLGRGLGALMSPSFVSIEPTAPAAAPAPQPAVGEAPSAAPPFIPVQAAAPASAARPQPSLSSREPGPREDVEGMLLYLPAFALAAS